MTIASGSRLQYTLVKEVTRGTTPGTPSCDILRLTTPRRLSLNPNALESGEVDASRQRTDTRLGFRAVDGEFGFAYSRQAFDELFEGLLGGTWTAVAATASPNLTIDATAKTVTRAAGSYVTDGFRAGDLVVGVGFSSGANNAIFRVASVAATVLTLLDPSGVLVDEGPVAATMDLKGKRLDIGTTLSTYSIEKQWLDLTKYQVFNGVAVNTCEMSIGPENPFTGSFGLVGMSATDITGTSIDGTPTAAPTNRVMTSFDGALYEGGTLIAIATGLTIRVNNDRTTEGVIGSKFSPDIFEGTCKVDGELAAFFQNEDVYTKFINETPSSLWFKADDPDDSTEFVSIIIPALTYSGANDDPPQEGPITMTYPFYAAKDSTTGFSFWIQRSNA